MAKEESGSGHPDASFFIKCNYGIERADFDDRMRDVKGVERRDMTGEISMAPR